MRSTQNSSSVGPAPSRAFKGPSGAGLGLFLAKYAAKSCVGGGESDRESSGSSLTPEPPTGEAFSFGEADRAERGLIASVPCEVSIFLAPLHQKKACITY